MIALGESSIVVNDQVNNGVILSMKHPSRNTRPVTHSFRIEDAENHGIQAAIILYHLAYLQSSKHDKDGSLHDGKHWVNYTYQALHNTFPYLSIPQIKRTMTKLTDAGIVVKDHLSKQRFNRELYWHIPLAEIVLSDSTESSVVHSTKSSIVLHPSNINLLHTTLETMFEEFYSAYPRKTAKQAGLKAWMKLKH